MITLHLSSDEQHVLTRVIEEYLSELGMEIRDTENWEFKTGLKEEQAFLVRLLDNLRGQSASLDTIQIVRY